MVQCHDGAASHCWCSIILVRRAVLRWCNVAAMWWCSVFGTALPHRVGSACTGAVAGYAALQHRNDAALAASRWRSAAVLAFSSRWCSIAGSFGGQCHFVASRWRSRAVLQNHAVAAPLWRGCAGCRVTSVQRATSLSSSIQVPGCEEKQAEHHPTEDVGATALL